LKSKLKTHDAKGNKNSEENYKMKVEGGEGSGLLKKE
jgi:hypothetical protein